ncbi:hypothetical protein ACLOJK_038002 [Asimina triloba]
MVEWVEWVFAYRVVLSAGSFSSELPWKRRPDRHCESLIFNIPLGLPSLVPPPPSRCESLFPDRVRLLRTIARPSTSFSHAWRIPNLQHPARSVPLVPPPPSRCKSLFPDLLRWPVPPPSSLRLTLSSRFHSDLFFAFSSFSVLESLSRPLSLSNPFFPIVPLSFRPPLSPSLSSQFSLYLPDVERDSSGENTRQRLLPGTISLAAVSNVRIPEEEAHRLLCDCLGGRWEILHILHVLFVVQVVHLSSIRHLPPNLFGGDCSISRNKLTGTTVGQQLPKP